MGLTLFASVVEAAAAINICSTAPGVTGNCSGLYGFAVALGVVSALSLAIYLLMFTFARDKLFEKSMMYPAFLFLWWMAGVGATTFTTSTAFFSFAGTLYFSTWCAFIFSGFIMHSEWEQFRSAVANMRQMEASSRSTFYLLLASLVEAIAAAFVCGTPDATGTGAGVCSGQEVYALIAGIVSLILCLALLRVDSEKFGGADKFVGLFLALWWAVAMGYLTIAGPFIIAGNGFFATWAAFFASFFVAQNKIFPASANAGMA